MNIYEQINAMHEVMHNTLKAYLVAMNKLAKQGIDTKNDEVIMKVGECLKALQNAPTYAVERFDCELAERWAKMQAFFEEARK